MSMRLFPAFAALGALASACAGSPRAPSAVIPAVVPAELRSEYTAQVDGYLSRLAGNARNQGYTRVVSGPLYGRLSDHATASHEMDLIAGSDYALLGACDNDCSNLDLRLHDSAGTMQGEDVESDDTPVVTFTAPSSGRYRIDVIMASCSRNPCFYGIQLVAR